MTTSELTCWDIYWDQIKPRLNKRADTFEQIFDYLERIVDPVIVETGTYREENNYEGDGCSTLLFDQYVAAHGGVPSCCSACIITTHIFMSTTLCLTHAVVHLLSLQGPEDDSAHD